MGFFGGPFLVNFAFLAIPVAVTLAVLFGVDAQRSASGQPPIYSPTATVGPGLTPHNNKIITTTYCQKSYGITPETKGQEFTLNPNQWGWEASEGGGLCMNVTTYNNGSYPTKSTAPEWSVTWEYPQGPESQPVHAFPNVLVDGGIFPATVQSLSRIGLDMRWTYGLGNASATAVDQTALTAESLNANVAVDTFLDSDKTKSSDSTAAAYEVMVWFADFGAAAQPIGLADGPVTTEVLDGNTFSLYAGDNSLNQTVLTWLASDTVDTFNGDLMPLFTKLFSLDDSKYPRATDYLGYFAFGSEAYYSEQFVTFTVPHLSINVTTA